MDRVRLLSLVSGTGVSQRDQLLVVLGSICVEVTGKELLSWRYVEAVSYFKEHGGKMDRGVLEYVLGVLKCYKKECNIHRLGLLFPSRKGLGGIRGIEGPISRIQGYRIFRAVVERAWGGTVGALRYLRKLLASVSAPAPVSAPVSAPHTEHMVEFDIGTGGDCWVKQSPRLKWLDGMRSLLKLRFPGEGLEPLSWYDMNRYIDKLGEEVFVRAIRKKGLEWPPPYGCVGE